jgi:hypothetical protein
MASFDYDVVIIGSGFGESVAAPFRGVLPLPISALKSGSPVLRNLANRNRAVPLTYEQFCYAFANAVSEEEATSCTSSSRCRPRGSRFSGRVGQPPSTPTGARC